MREAWVGALLGDVRDVHEARVLDRAVQLAPDAVPGCERAGITHRVGRRYRTLAASDAVVEQANRCQFDLDEGPCVSATWDQEVVSVSDTASDRRFPRWAAEVSRLGVGATTSVRLSAIRRGKVATALSVFASRAGVFDDMAVVRALRGYADEVVTALAVAQQLDGLRNAVDGRHRIGLAQGILMARHSMTVDRSFTVLNATARNNNLKMSAVVERVVDEGDVPADLRSHEYVRPQGRRPRPR